MPQGVRLFAVFIVLVSMCAIQNLDGSAQLEYLEMITCLILLENFSLMFVSFIS